MITSGPRSGSLFRVAMKFATRSPRLRMSSVTDRTHREIMVVHVHHHAAAAERIESVLGVVGRAAHAEGDVRRGRASERARRVPGDALVVGQRAHEANAF